MKFIKAYLHNLLIMALVIIGTIIFTKIFYPEALKIFSLMGEVYSGLNLWPIIILILLGSALPRRNQYK